MVVVSIMVVVTGLILVRQSSFDSSTLLRSLAYSVALSVRQAQVYGSSIFGTTTATCTGRSLVSGVCYANAYGIHFAKGSTTYTLFADLNNNGHYDTGEAIKTFSLNNGYAISDFCATQISNSSLWCAVANGGSLSWVDVVFHRPNPEACIASDAGQTSVCAPGQSAFYSKVKLTIINSNNSTATRSITVTQTGEIAVCALSGC